MTGFPYQIPAELLSAWMEGKLKIVGATLRWVDTNLIAGHMAPVNEAAAEKLAVTLGNLPGGITSLIPGLQVINLGVNVAGFAYMAVKMESISRQIAVLGAQMKFIAVDVQTTRQINETAMIAELLAGVEEAQRGERLRDVAMLHAARRELSRGFLHHISMIPAMIRDGNAAVQLSGVEAYVQRAAVLATAVARCDWLAEGPQEAKEWLEQARERLRGALNDLRNAYAREHDFVEHLAHDNVSIKDFFERSRGLLAVLESHEAQIGHAGQLGLLTPADWDAYLQEQSRVREVLFLPPRPVSEEPVYPSTKLG